MPHTRRAITNEYLSWRRRPANREVPTLLPEVAVDGHDETTRPTTPPSVTQTNLVTSGPMTFTRQAVSPGAVPGAGGAGATTTVTVSPTPPP